MLTGVSGPADLLAAPPERRPTYVAADLSGLFRPAADAAVPVPGAELDGWRLDRERVGATLSGSGDPVAALRLLCGATWDGVPASVADASAQARPLLESWGVAGA